MAINWWDVAVKLKPLLAYKAEKYVSIQDWRLGVMLRFMEACILLWVAYDIIKKKSYLVREVPIGVQTSYGYYPGAMTNEVLTKELDSDFCKKPDQYNYQYLSNDEEWNYEDFHCTPLTEHMTWRRSSDEIAFITHIHERATVLSAQTPPPGPCPNNYEDLPGAVLARAKGEDGRIFDRCTYEKDTQLFTMLVEDMRMAFIHKYITSGEVDVSSKSGRSPRTYFVDNEREGKFLSDKKGTPDDEKVYRKYKSGKYSEIEFSVRDWLKMANVSLDEIGVGTGKEGPYIRLQGVRIVVDIKYYNFRLTPDKYAFMRSLKGTKNDFDCIVELSAQRGWTALSNEGSYMNGKPTDPAWVKPTDKNGPNNADEFITKAFIQHGIVFQFKASGLIGEFSFKALLTSIVEGTVLLKLAGKLVYYVALYGLGLRSKLYKEFLKEKVDYRREYARFAAQALVSSYVYSLVPKTGAELTDRDIFMIMKRFLGHSLSTDELVRLTDYVLTTADTDQLKKGERLRMISKPEDRQVAQNTIDIAEFIEIFTEGQVSITSLRRIINSEYQTVPKLSPDLMEEIQEHRFSNHGLKDDKQQSYGSNGVDKQDSVALPQPPPQRAESSSSDQV